MIHDPIAGLAAVVAIGVAGQLVAERLRIPSIIVLLLAGLAVGPGLGWINPDDLYGDLLFPAVSAAVGVLLFEGGLSLRWRELGGVRVVVLRLLTLGVVVAAVVGTGAAWTAGGLPLGPSVLFGAIMVVTGPTVVVPLLREARLRPRVARVLRWEGIFVDPIGAVMAVVVLEVLVVRNGGPADAIGAIAKTAAVGTIVGLAAAAVLIAAIHRKIVPDHLENAVAFVTVLGTLAAADAVFHEAGLVATTVLGFALASQRRVRIRDIAEFHESIALLLVPLMFILLAARVQSDELSRNLVPALGVLALLVLVSRPLSVWVSTIGSHLPSRERAYIATMAPRGIVAASVSALFGLKLEQQGIAGGADLAALTFLVVAGTVVVYGFAAMPLAKRLRVDVPAPAGFVLVGAPPWAASLGAVLADHGVPVLVVALDDDDAEAAASRGLLTYTGRLQSEDLAEAVTAIGAKLALVVSDREEVAAFATDRLGRLLGKTNVHVVAADAHDKEERSAQPGEHWGQLAFGGRLTLEDAAALTTTGATCFPSPADATGNAFALVRLGDDGIPKLATGDPSDAGGTLIVLGVAPQPTTSRSVLHPLRGSRVARRS